MDISIRAFAPEDAAQAAEIWNRVVRDGVAFPQLEPLDESEARAFFSSQSFTGIALCGDEIAGLYILHPNNIGRCAHLCNASYAVRADLRGRHVGETLVTHCLRKAKELGFRVLQLNVVVATNTPALALYQKLGFTRLGTIPGGFLMDDGHYEDIVPHYITL